MSHEIGRTINGLTITAFYGGDDRGQMLQLTGDTGFVQITLEEAHAIVQLLKQWVIKNKNLSQKEAT